MYYKEVQQMLFFTWFVALDKALLKMCDTSGFWAHAIYLWLSASHCWSVMTVSSTRCFPNVLPAWPAFFIRHTLFILLLNKTAWVTLLRWFVFHFKLNCGHKAFNPQIRIFLIDSLWFSLSLLSPVLSAGFKISLSKKTEFCSHPSTEGWNGLSPL